MRSIHGPASPQPLPAQLPPSITRLIAHESLLGWSQQEDEQFWRDLGGMRGMFRLRRNMVTLVKVGDGSDFITQRARAVTVCTLLIFCFGVFRVFYRGLPHITARFAATLYFEARVRVETVRSEFSLKLLETPILVTDNSMKLRYHLRHERRREAGNAGLSAPAASGSAALPL